MAKLVGIDQIIATAQRAPSNAPGSYEQGYAAAAARATAVMASEAGRANPGLAAFLLEHNTGSADDIIAALGRAPLMAADRAMSRKAWDSYIGERGKQPAN